MKEITSVHNAAVQLLRELQKPRARRENGLFVCESAKLVGEAVALRLAQAFFIEKGREAEYAPMIEQAESAGCELYVVSTAVMQAVSTAKTPQGVVCTARIPQPPKALAGRRLVALDGVQDPGNVGTIIRTADAAGLDGVLLSNQCADVFSPKVLRATMGSIFRMNLRTTDDLPGELTKLREKGYSILSSQLDGTPFYERQGVAERFALIIGNEGNGVSEQVQQTATHRVRLPMRGGAESLNAAIAAAIMMYELMR